jgi:hypothetical protein
LSAGAADHRVEIEQARAKPETARTEGGRQDINPSGKVGLPYLLKIKTMVLF